MRKKPNNQKTVIAYWLVPAKPERELFSALIRILAGQMRGPRFEPHVTIFSTPLDQGSPKKVLARIKSARLPLGVRGIGTSADYRKTMFIRLSPGKSLERLTAQLRRETKSSGKTSGDLHLSLLYKNLPPSTRRGLAASVKLPFSQIVFDCIKAVRCSSPTRNRSHVKAWRVLAKKSLR